MAKSRGELADRQDGYLHSREYVNSKKSSKLNFLIHKILKVLKKKIKSHKILPKYGGEEN